MEKKEGGGGKGKLRGKEERRGKGCGRWRREWGGYMFFMSPYLYHSWKLI